MIEPRFTSGLTTLYEGDCIEVMRELPDESVDAVVTDPPYGLNFMGKDWDRYGTRDFGSWVESWARECLRVLKPGGHLVSFGGPRTWHRLTSGIEDAGFDIRDSIAWLYGSGFPKSHNLEGDWEGWGTALKPAHEPIVVARKRLRGTVALNVVQYGTGALNINASRIPHVLVNGGNLADNPQLRGTKKRAAPVATAFGRAGDESALTSQAGRWPSNVILDDVQSSYLESESGASRFFYAAKAGRAERPEVAGVKHPTVKPLSLMRWLVRLVTPPGGVVVDPFSGSGTTIEACISEGFSCVGIEREASYIPLILQRIHRANSLAVLV